MPGKKGTAAAHLLREGRIRLAGKKKERAVAGGRTIVGVRGSNVIWFVLGGLASANNDQRRGEKRDLIRSALKKSRSP